MTQQSSVLAFHVNGRGETYGSALKSHSPSQMPDLIEVRASNGLTGYVRKSDLLGPPPTLQQVESYPRDAQGNFVAPTASAAIPVYLSDGVTIIGQFAVGATVTSSNVVEGSSSH